MSLIWVNGVSYPTCLEAWLQKCLTVKGQGVSTDDHQIRSYKLGDDRAGASVSFPYRRALKYGFISVSRSKEMARARTTINSKSTNLGTTALHALLELAAIKVFDSDIRSLCSPHSLKISTVFPLLKGPRMRLMP